MLKVGLVGVGGISGAHIPAWEKREDAQLVALCDIRPERMEKFSDKRCYLDFDENGGASDGIEDSIDYEVEDVLDALALAVTAKVGYKPIPSNPISDSKGLTMQIVVADI